MSTVKVLHDKAKLLNIQKHTQLRDIYDRFIVLVSYIQKLDDSVRTDLERVSIKFMLINIFNSYLIR